MLEKIKKYRVILASASPRRRQLLEEMGIRFDIEPKYIDEDFPLGMKPEAVAEYLSRKKADAFSGEIDENILVITADTIVAINDKILGKPADKKEAVEILQELSGNTHKVITGVTLKTLEKEVTFSVSTDVIFKKLSFDEIDYYIENFQPFDKAGAYGIQEWIGHIAIEHISGSYFNVMGLPTHRLYEELSLFV
ncbi:MAG: septum formation protein Maf [Chlorobi bacterium]|nr:septum formation protein Maf [Chlorobiota bacterium]